MDVCEKDKNIFKLWNSFFASKVSHDNSFKHYDNFEKLLLLFVSEEYIEIDKQELKMNCLIFFTDMYNLSLITKFGLFKVLKVSKN